jgi:formylmethanofuran dehydrogenase subunit E
MKEKHAMVERDGFKVPLIGIPPDAVLQECDLCHDEFPMRQLEITDNGQVLCEKCRGK